ncbi:hypothetical protein GW17_00047171 [Ensete ventricosum]|nr:hypothetical protein GW17_00047171 [Ensete ventricosum]
MAMRKGAAYARAAGAIHYGHTRASREPCGEEGERSTTRAEALKGKVCRRCIEEESLLEGRKFEEGRNFMEHHLRRKRQARALTEGRNSVARRNSTELH